MKEQDKQKILTIISTYAPQAQVFLFGSRARKDHTPQSDIDIAIDNTTAITFCTLGQIKEKIEESTIPFSVDIVDLNNTSSDLKKQILQEGIIWKK